MKILAVKTLTFPEVKVIKFARYGDQRGYFTEIFRRSDFNSHPELSFFKELEFLQSNESYSKKETIRGLHFQWNPYMGKLVRTIHGHMVDLFLDLRKGSPTFGKISAYDMPSTPDKDYAEWIWVPVGFAHGNFYLEDTTIEYFCTGEYNPECEVGISPLAPDIDWSLCDQLLKEQFAEIAGSTELMSKRDRNGLSVSEWENDPRSRNFIYGED